MDSLAPDLVARAQAGDHEARQSLVLALRPEVHAAIQEKLSPAVRPRVEVGDLVQETLLRGLLAVETMRFRGTAAFRSWLLTIADNVAREAHRRHLVAAGRSVNREASPSEIGRAGGDPSDATPEPARLLRREERFNRLRDAMQRLSPEHREVISLARLEGWPLARVAERMGRSPDAASALLLRALRQLRRHFGPTDSMGLPARKLEPFPAPDASGR